MERKEHSISSDQLVANIDEMVIMIDAYILKIKRMLSSKEITLNEDKALFYGMNLMMTSSHDFHRGLSASISKRVVPASTTIASS